MLTSRALPSRGLYVSKYTDEELQVKADVTLRYLEEGVIAAQQLVHMVALRMNMAVHEVIEELHRLREGEGHE